MKIAPSPLPLPARAGTPPLVESAASFADVLAGGVTIGGLAGARALGFAETGILGAYHSRLESGSADALSAQAHVIPRSPEPVPPLIVSIRDEEAQLVADLPEAQVALARPAAEKVPDDNHASAAFTEVAAPTPTAAQPRVNQPRQDERTVKTTSILNIPVRSPAARPQRDSLVVSEDAQGLSVAIRTPDRTASIRRELLHQIHKLAFGYGVTLQDVVIDGFKLRPVQPNAELGD